MTTIFSILIPRLPLVCFLLLVLFFWPLHLQASEYRVEPFNKLCQEAADSANYTSSRLKSLRYLVEVGSGWVYRTKNAFITDFRENDSYSELGSLVKLLENRGIHLLLVYLPTRGLMNPQGIPSRLFDRELAAASYKRKLAKLAETGALVPDLGSLLDHDDAERYYFKRDIHWTPSGAKLTAEIVGKTIREAGIIKSYPAFRVDNEADALFTIKSGLSEGIQELCGNLYPIEWVQGYSSKSYFEEGENDLFAVDPKEEVALVGTSFSAIKDLNFKGFLEEEIHSPIINYAMPAGNDIGSWLTYLQSEEFADAPPKLIIWEIPGYYMLDDPALFGRLESSIRQSAGEENIILQKEVRLPEPGTVQHTLFFSDELLSVPLSKIIIELQLSDPEINEVEFRLWYRNGKSKKEKLKNPKRAQLGGWFSFALYGELEDRLADLVAMELLEVAGKSVDEYLSVQQKKALVVNVKVYNTVH